MENNIKKECMCRTESLSHTAEISTTLQINSTSLKKKGGGWSSVLDAV